MTKNRIFYLPPPAGEDIKELFRFAASSGIGKRSHVSGLPPAPWTTDELLEALGNNEHIQSDVDRRTVQLWFQPNDKGISRTNIRWLAQIFGGGDHTATTDWQVALFAGQQRLVAKRRANRSHIEDNCSAIDSAGPSQGLHPVTADSRSVVVGRADATPATTDASYTPSEAYLGRDPSVRPRGISLRTEAIFLHGSVLNIPCAIFAGAVALGFISYILGIHNVSYVNRLARPQQIGFLWAPNWTVLFMIFFPAYFGVLLPSHRKWRSLRRVGRGSRTEFVSWPERVAAFGPSYLAVFVICLPVAGVLQWLGVRLLPLLDANIGSYAHDWGSITIIRPDLIGVAETIAFTGLAYIYMSVCFYLLFAALILQFSLVIDAAEIAVQPQTPSSKSQNALDEGILSIFVGVYRATILGLFIAICMKIQSAYLTSGASNILQWLASDLLFALTGEPRGEAAWTYSRPNHYSSMIIVLALCFVFASSVLRLVNFLPTPSAQAKGPVFTVAFLVCGYVFIGAFDGFSILLAASSLCALVSLRDPLWENIGPLRRNGEPNVS